MYLQNITIKNIGPIEDLSIELSFKENGDPKPAVFVGENGSGKTILQSQIIDSFYEIGSFLFDDIGVQDGLKRNFYKVSGGVNLQTGKDKGFSLLKFIDHENQILEYFDKVGEVKKEDFTNYISDFALSPDDSKKNQKETTRIDSARKEKLQSEWVQGVHFYQPAYRYEEPFWKNELFIDYTRFEEKKKFLGRLGKELEIISSTKENKSFLLDLVLDRFVQNSNPNNFTLWENINSIIRKILKNDRYRFGIGPRGGSRVSIVEDQGQNKSKQRLLSIDNLSLGESILLNLFVNIIRHSGNHSKQLNQIQGIVAIDEIDVHLHTDLQSSVLPELIKLFPKVQFIITTHSPLFLLGMKKIFNDDGFEIRNMPNGKLITTERFSEFENAYNVLKKTEKFEDEVKTKVVANNKPIVYVEGPTDVKYIKKAYELYKKTCDDFDIEIIGERTDSGTKNSNNKALFNAQKLLSTNLNLLKQKVILLNDPEESIKETEYENLLYIRKIPQFTRNPLQKGIENLFKTALINKAKKQFPSDFSYLVKNDKKENFKIDSNKQKICNWICQNGTENDFKNFEKIFEIIEKIIESDSKSS
jgi:predicted ATPase